MIDESERMIVRRRVRPQGEVWTVRVEQTAGGSLVCEHKARSLALALDAHAAEREALAEAARVAEVEK